MKIDHLTGTAGACLLLLFAASSHAALIDNGNGFIYDDDLDITWFTDTDSVGPMDWDSANAWADALTVGSAIDWRLPTASACTGSPCTGEFNHLFYDELGGTDGTPMTGNVDPFTNIQGAYWTDSEYDATHAWFFRFSNSGLAGTRDWGAKSTPLAVWAVHTGNISAVPVPAALWLFASGLLCLFGMSRRS
jgi:hypothetical protein